MADITLATDLGPDQHYHKILGPIWTSTLVGYMFYGTAIITNSWDKVVYKKTTDGGQTWGAAVTVFDDTSGGGLGVGYCLSIWYDRWTPGDSGNLVYIMTGTNEGAVPADGHVLFRTLDLSSDTLSAVVLVASPGEPSAFSGSSVIVKARNGNLYLGGTNGQSAIGFYRSVDGGATWTARSAGPFTFVGDFVEAVNLYPGLETDTADVWLTYFVRASKVYRLYVYDDSADSWSSTDIRTTPSFTAATAACTRLSDGHVLLMTYDSPGDPRFFDIASPASITEKTSPMTGSSESAFSLMVSELDSAIWFAYVRSNVVYYRKSSDGGTTWDAELPMSQDAHSQVAQTWQSSALPASGRLYVVWIDNSAKDLFSNYANSVEIAPVPEKVRVTGLRHVYRPGSYRLEMTIGDVTGAVELPQPQFIGPRLEEIRPEAPRPAEEPYTDRPRPILEHGPYRPRVPVPKRILPHGPYRPRTAVGAPKLPATAPFPTDPDLPRQDAGMWRPSAWKEYQASLERTPLGRAELGVARRVWNWAKGLFR